MTAFAAFYSRTNTPVQTGVLVRVMDRLKHRGPDGQRFLQNGRVAMGHWHFWTTPEEVGETQPLRLAGLPFTIVLDGRLDNRPELTDNLGLRKNEAASHSDAALILRAYDRWGDDCAKRFIGEFAFVIHDEAKNELFCARDALGDRTFFYSDRGGLVVIASEPWAVAGADASPAELDEGAVVNYFSFQDALDDQTFFKDVFEGLPAHTMHVTESGIRQRRYWQLNPTHQLRGLTDEEYAGEFLRLLELSVQTRMRSTTPVGILMSGGLDSTSVASLAARMIAPKRLTAISHVLETMPECDERAYMNAMVERWNVRSIQIPCDDAWPYKDWNNLPRNPNEPDINIYRLMKERLYRRANREGLRVLLTGDYGDDLYGAGTQWFADMLAEGNHKEALKEASLYLRYAGIRETVRQGFIQPAARMILKRLPLAHRVRRKSSFPRWLSPKAKHFQRSSNSTHPPLFDRNPNLLFTASPGEIFHTGRHNVELRYPYHDQRMIEYMASLPGYQLYFRNVNKIVLRNAMRGILPEEIRTRLRPTSLIQFFARGTEKERKIWETYLEDQQAVWRRFIREDFLVRQWNSQMTPEQDGPNYVIPWLCASFESWYSAQFSSN